MKRLVIQEKLLYKNLLYDRVENESTTRWQVYLSEWEDVQKDEIPTLDFHYNRMIMEESLKRIPWKEEVPEA